MNFGALLYTFVVFITHTLYAPNLTINSPGLYTLGDNITVSPTSGDNIVSIQSSNVVLDLGQRIISQTNSTTSVNGIVVNGGLRHIKIKNGTIRAVSNTGIIINQGCQNIEVSDVTFQNCSTRAIDCSGTAANQITNLAITNCIVLDSCTGVASDYIITLTQCSNCVINKCFLSNNGNIARNLSAVRLDGCKVCECRNVIINNNNGSSFVGIDINSTGSSYFYNCLIEKNSALTTTLVGIILNTASSANNALNVCQDCKVLENLASTTLTGIALSQQALQNVFSNCTVMSNTANFVVGFSYIPANGRLATENVFIECIASNNRSTNGTDGFLINGSNFGALLRCIASYNSATNNNCAGISVVGSGGNRWAIIDCQCLGNVGNSGATSFGVRQITGSNNLYTRCIAFNNNTTQANQLIGVISQATIGATQTSNLNSPTGPWTNIPIAS